MFGSEMVWYLFLGGTGAGALLVLTVLELLVPAPRPAARAAYPTEGAAAAEMYRVPFATGHAAAGIALLTGCILLMCDLGRLDRIASLFVSPQPSLIAVGTYTLTAAVLLDGALLALWGGSARLRPTALVRLLDALTAACALAAMVYTGLLLASMRAVPLWATGWLPALFAASALSCGTAIVAAAFTLTGADLAFPAAMRGVAAVDLVAIALEALCAGLVVAHAAGAQAAGSPTALAGALSARSLLVGENAALFWGGFVAAGLIIPVALDLAQLRSRRHTPLAVLTCTACILVGGLALRQCMVAAGMHPPLL